MQNIQSQKEIIASIGQIQRKQSSKFYDTSCPEIVLNSIDGETINLNDLVGNVIIIKFSRFYKKDLSDLVYLDHLSRKYKKAGISLIFVNSLGKHYGNEISKICSFFSPIVVDDGSISGLLNAGMEDTVIVDRNFTIRFMSNMSYIFNKPLIYNEVMKWTFEEIQPPQKTSKKELTSILSQLSFHNINKGQKTSLNKMRAGDKVIFTLFTSTCTGCQENQRIQLLKEVSSRLNPEKSKIIFLFGIGNNANSIKQYAFINGWNEFPITVGVMDELKTIQEDDYYKLFEFDTDPRTIILNKKGDVVFAENLKNSKLIDLNFLLKKK